MVDGYVCRVESYECCWDNKVPKTILIWTDKTVVGLKIHGDESAPIDRVRKVCLYVLVPCDICMQLDA